MARSFTSSSDNLVSSSTIATGPGLTQFCWAKPTSIGNGTFIMTQGVGGSAFNRYTLAFDFNNNKTVAAQAADASSVVEAVTSATATAGSWQTFAGSEIASNSRASYLNGTNKGSSGSSRTISGVNAMRVSGRLSDGAFGYLGLLAHLAGWARALDDLEHLYLGGGGHPRSIQNLTYYCRLNQGVAPEAPDVGSITLTVNNTTFSNSDMPTIATFFTGTTVPNQSYTQGVPIPSISIAAQYEDVSSAYTVSLYQIGAAAGTTTATAGGTTARIIPITSAAGVVANDYGTIGAGPLTRILAVSGTNVLVETDQTWNNGDTFTHYPCTAAPISGLSVTAGVFGGSPVSAMAITGNYLFRAINNTTATLVADSNTFSIQVLTATVGILALGAGMTPILAAPQNPMQFSRVLGISSQPSIPGPLSGLYASTSLIFAELTQGTPNVGYIPQPGPGLAGPFNLNQFQAIDGASDNPSATTLALNGILVSSSVVYGGSNTSVATGAGLLASSSTLYGQLDGIQAGAMSGLIASMSVAYSNLTGVGNMQAILASNSTVEMQGVGGSFQPLVPFTAVVDVRLGIGYQPWRVKPVGTSG